MPSQDRFGARRKQSRLPGAAAVGLAVLLATGLAAVLHVRIGLSSEVPAKTALTVAATEYRAQQSYQREVSYLGLVVAGRKAKLGFEVPGQIAELPVRPGSPVTRGDTIARLDDSSLQAQRRATAAELERARAELELAQLKSRRQQELRASGAVSKEAFDETRLRARALASGVEAMIARLLALDIELEKSHLRAPYDGLVADRYVHQGAVVTPGTPVVRLIATATREAHIGVAVSRARELTPGARYTLNLRDQPFPATLLSVRPDVDPVTRVVTAVFAIADEFDATDGEPVSLLLQEAVPLSGGWLPIGALLEGRRGVWTVLAIEQQGAEYRVVREAVEVLDVRGDQAYVSGSLASGARVVASGSHRIAPGTTVQVEAQP